jgi:hypothetical protein
MTNIRKILRNNILHKNKKVSVRDKLTLFKYPDFFKDLFGWFFLAS